MNIEDWSPHEDEFLKPKEIEIHNSLHEKWAEQNELSEEEIFKNKEFRIESLKTAISRVGKSIHGKILEVGAGNGWCSAYIHKNYDIEHIHTMEIDQPAVEKLIPQIFKSCSVNMDKATLVKGSFNKIKLANHFDFVIAMGALHHSANLYITYKTLYKSLKPGGWLIAQEPALSNMVGNDYYFEREKKSVDLQQIGLIVKNNERSDVFYRECQHRSIGFNVGFNFHAERVYKPDEIKHQNFLDKLLGKPKQMMPEETNKPNNIIIYAQKPLENTEAVPVTNWEEQLLNNGYK